jgi:hypothetical protein
VVCRWWPGLVPAHYGFRFTLIVVKRKPVRKVVSQGSYCSEKEILSAIDLLGRDGYDFIWECRSYVQMEFGTDSEDVPAFRAALDRLPAGYALVMPVSGPGNAVLTLGAGGASVKRRGVTIDLPRHTSSAQ